jgi:UDP-3-O-[3-hydroxymyristoyl] glucosamine N-acyltransferase
MVHLSEIIQSLKPNKVIGNKDKYIINALKLDSVNTREDVLMWVSAKFKDRLKEVRYGVIICAELPEEFISNGCTYLITDNPRLSFQIVLTNFFMPKKSLGVSAKASIAFNVKLGKDIFIGNNVTIEEDCSIGDRTSIDHNTIIKKGTIIGSNVIIGANSTIGGVGFGYEKDETGQYVFIPHIGNVVIEDYVEIGNNTCIDRAVLGSTILKKNVKVDNLVHIAHGVKVGENSLIIANAMVAGSVDIGKNTWVAPSSSILNGKKVGSNVTIGLAAVVVKDVIDGETVIGSPAEEISKVREKNKVLREKIYKA